MNTFNRHLYDTENVDRQRGITPSFPTGVLVKAILFIITGSTPY